MNAEIKFDERGLVPAVVQDARSGQVLMLAYMNAEALQRSLESGELYFWSRSRQQLWHKGETSGNTLHLEKLLLDCDGDTLLAQVHPAGPACHTGHVTCFFRNIEGNDQPQPFSLQSLYDTIRDRQAHPRPGSYTASLFEKGQDEIVKKVGEEAVEVILAAKGQGKQRVIEESADLLYHLLVLLADQDLGLEDVIAELDRRHR